LDKEKDKNKDIMPSGVRSDEGISDANTTLDIASSKALHDQKVESDNQLIDAKDEEVKEEDFDKFDIDAVDKLEESKDSTNQDN
jgi:hypothetical protein